MGWWKCNCWGGIDWDNKPSGIGPDSLINAIPNRDTNEDHYNGDGPADVMGWASDEFKEWFKGREKPTADQIIELFIFNKIDPIFDFIGKEELTALIANTWNKIEKLYLQAWKRPPFEEEKVYICKFVFRTRTGNIPSDFWRD